MSTAPELAIRRGARPRLSPRAAALAAIATGALFALAQEPAGAWPFALVCLAPLLAALAGRGVLARARIGALAGALAAVFVAIGPAAIGAASFFGLAPWQGWAIATAVGEAFGIAGFASFAVLAGDPLHGSAPRAAVRAGLAFAVAEWVRGTIFGGLPWLLLAHALAPVPELLALARLGGVALLSLWIAAIAVAALRLALGPDRAGAVVVTCVAAAAAVAAALTMPAPGSLRVASADAQRPGEQRVALVQPGLPLEQWADPMRARDTVEHLARVTREALAGAADLVVWPENAMQALLPANEGFVRSALAALADRSDALLLGAPRYAPEDPTRRFNAALLYRDPAGAPAVHDKTKLLPIFETTPRWLAAFGRDGADLTPGAAPRVLEASDALRLGPLLCYEVLFAAIARAQVRSGAGVLVNLSNDAWFAGSAGAEQHFAAAVVQAAATARPLLRATPTGVTAAIDAGGRVVARLAPGRPGVLVVDVAPAREIAPAARLGAAPDAIAIALSALWLAADRVRTARGIARGA